MMPGIGAGLRASPPTTVNTTSIKIDQSMMMESLRNKDEEAYTKQRNSGGQHRAFSTSPKHDTTDEDRRSSSTPDQQHHQEEIEDDEEVADDEMRLKHQQQQSSSSLIAQQLTIAAALAQQQRSSPDGAGIASPLQSLMPQAMMSQFQQFHNAGCFDPKQLQQVCERLPNRGLEKSAMVLHQLQKKFHIVPKIKFFLSIG